MVCIVPQPVVVVFLFSVCHGRKISIKIQIFVSFHKVSRNLKKQTEKILFNQTRIDMLSVSVPSFVERDELGNEEPEKPLPSTLLSPPAQKAKIHTFFNINLENEAGVRWVISKRYTDFADLYAKVRSNGDLVSKPGDAFIFPSKQYFGHSDDIKEERRAAFENLLQILNNNVTSTEALEDFLEVNEKSPSKDTGKREFVAYDTSPVKNRKSEDTTVVTAMADGSPILSKKQKKTTPVKSKKSSKKISNSNFVGVAVLICLFSVLIMVFIHPDRNELKGALSVELEQGLEKGRQLVDYLLTTIKTRSFPS